MSESPHRALAAVPPAPDPAVNGVRDLEVDFQALVERVPAVTYVAGFGEDGEWLYVSPQIESMLGFTSQEWRADPDRWMLQIGRVLPGGDIARAVMRGSATAPR